MFASLGIIELLIIGIICLLLIVAVLVIWGSRRKKK